jgi:hypothetical protein
MAATAVGTLGKGAWNEFDWMHKQCSGIEI